MYIENSSSEKIVEALNNLQLNSNEFVMINICEQAKIDLNELVLQLSKIEISFIGGVFPGIIGDGKPIPKGTIIKVLSLASAPLLFNKISSQEFKLPECLNYITKNNHGDAIILLDGLSSNISGFLSSLFNVLGNTIRYIGGGAGSLSLQPTPCLFSNHGVYQDAAIICILESSISTGVKHGWEKLSGPFVATRTDKNTILELNWENAFSVYKKIVENDCKEILSEKNFFEHAKGYPFGILKEGSEYIVRDPISVNSDGALICVGEVSENAVVDILKGSTKKLINASKDAVSSACNGNKYNNSLIIDCISRFMYLGEEYPKSIDIIKNQIESHNCSLNLEGMLTLGEISTYGRGYLEFLNKTIVVGLY